MKSIAFAVVLCFAAAPALADKITPTGPVKAYKGPEGQIVAMLEISDGKEMLVHFRNLDTDLDNKTVRYLVADAGNVGSGDKDVYINKKRGSKTYRSYLLSLRDRSWTFTHPSKANVSFDLSYSEEWSGKIKADDIINALKP
jgi:hypothetical protein